MCASMKFRFTLLAGIVLVAASAQADDRGAYELRFGSTEMGSVRSVPGGDPEKSIAIATSDITPALVSELRAFYDGKTSQKSLVLASGAVVKRANEARLASVKLPAVGVGTAVIPRDNGVCGGGDFGIVICLRGGRKRSETTDIEVEHDGRHARCGEADCRKEQQAEFPKGR